MNPTPRRRDPEGTRLAILRAAAEIIVEHGAATLTHRAVAARAGVAVGSTTRYFNSIEDLYQSALQLMADDIEISLKQVERELFISGDLSLETLPERGAHLFHQWLQDTEEVRASLVLIAAAISNPDARILSMLWTERLVTMMAQHIGKERAQALEVYLNGTIIHASLHDTPLEETTLAHVFRAILAMPVLESE